MKYYLVEITQYNDGTKDGVGIYSYGDYDTALATFYQKMSSGIKATNVAMELCQILSDGGVSMRIERWAEPVPEPTPEPTPEVNA